MLFNRQKGDAKPREHLPADKQYLLLQGGKDSTGNAATRSTETLILFLAPCPRRATSLVYTDAEEDGEQLLSMGGGSSQEDEWVQTHAGRSEFFNPNVSL
jgi:ubiquitin-like-conjugating enzyme ATG3